MMISSRCLIVKKSTLPMAGKGLFARTFIPKGEKIIEYKGKISTWKDADHQDGNNLYVFYVNKNHVINAEANKKLLARYANDAKGLSKVKGMGNNSKYMNDKNRIFITAIRDINPGDEIFVSYGKDYWDTIKKLEI